MGKRWRCKRCVGEYVTRRKQKVKRLLVDEAGGCCAVCGYDRCIVNLHFHHVDPSEKAFGLSMETTKALATYREELQKCVLLCANCHGEVEAGLMVGPPAGATFDDVLHVYGGVDPDPETAVADSQERDSEAAQTALDLD